MSSADENNPEKKSRLRKWLIRIGSIGFFFFLFKGMLWLVVFALILFGVMDESRIERIKSFLSF